MRLIKPYNKQALFLLFAVVVLGYVIFVLYTLSFHKMVLFFHTLLLCKINLTTFVYDMTTIISYDGWWMVRFRVKIKRLVARFPDMVNLSSHQTEGYI